MANASLELLSARLRELLSVLEDPRAARTELDLALASCRDAFTRVADAKDLAPDDAPALREALTLNALGLHRAREAAAVVAAVLPRVREARRRLEFARPQPPSGTSCDVAG